MRVESREERDGLEGFAEAHLVGEDAAEAVAVEVPEPGDADLLVGAKQGVERGCDGGGGELGQVSKRFAAGAPTGGRLIVRNEFVDEFLNFGDAGGGDAPGAAGGGGRGGAAGEGSLGGGQAGDFFRREKVDPALIFDVTTVGGEGGAELVFADAAGLEAEGEGELAAGLDDLALDVGLGELGGVFVEVFGEVGVEFVAEGSEVGCEKVEGFMAVAEPPFAGGGVEGEAVGFDEVEGGGVAGVLARG